VLREVVEYGWLVRRRGWPAERIRAHQDALFRRLVRHAYHEVAYYRDTLREAGIDPERVRGLVDLERFPVSRKQDYRRRTLSELVARSSRLDRCEMVQTSGSTGIPMTIYTSRSEACRRRAHFHRVRLEVGGRPLDRVLAIAPLREHRPHRLRGFLHPRGRLNARCTLDAAGVALARRFRPHVLWGLVSQLHLFALQVLREDVSDIRPRLVMPFGEMLSPQTRTLLEHAFQAPVRCYFGSWEFGAIAAACPEGEGYHLVTDAVHVEILRDGVPAPAGETGELVVTCLTSDVMPFIRYSLGDVARLARERCPCGHPYPKIEGVEGRTDDFLVLAGGELASPSRANAPLYNLTELLQFRVIQERTDRFRIEYVANEVLQPERQEQIRAYYRENLNASETELVRVREIGPDSSGKIRRVISHVSAGR
jgi:phenylacetate-CoA ligase